MLTRVRSLDSIEPLEADWERLADAVSAPPFARAGWIRAWNQAFGGGELTAVTVERDGRIAGLLPLLRRRGALVSPTNWHTPMFLPLAEDAEACEALLSAAVRATRRRLDLGFVPADGQLPSSLAGAAEQSGLAFESRVVQRSPWIELSEDWESYQSALSSKRRSGLRRLRRRLEERGEVSIQCSDGREGLEGLLEEGFRVEASGWKGERDTAIISRPETIGFYTDVARWAAKRGWLQLWFLRLDGRPLAFAYCLQDGQRLYEVKIGFEVSEARHGPGVVLTQARVEHAFRAGLASYEFLGQPAKHKLEWTDRCRSFSRLQAFSPTPAGRLSHLAWTRGRELALRMRARNARRRNGEARISR